MDFRRIVRIPGYRGCAPAAHGDALKSCPDSYVMCEYLSFSSGGEHSSRDDQAAVVSRLHVLTSKYAQFQRSIEGCVFAMSSGISASLLGSAPAARQASSRSPSEGLVPFSAADKGRAAAASRMGAIATSASTGSTSQVPDLESCWMSTSPLPPTAVLAALYGMTPLHRISWSGSGGRDPDAGAGENVRTVPTVDARNLGDTDSSTSSFELQWSLCRCTTDAMAAQGRYQVTFRDAFAMTTVVTHMAASSADGGSSWQGSTSLLPPPSSSSSTSSYSLAQQLRRASALLGMDSEGSLPEASAAAAPSTSLLDWPEEFLWNLLVSLLSSLALVHSAGLHLFGQLTAADVMCVACAPTLPRQLEQTWADVAAATAAAASKEDVRGAVSGTVSSSNIDDDRVSMHKEEDAIFQRFCSTAVPSVLLPQAIVTAATPCHHVFFVLHPSPELLQQQGDGRAHVPRQSMSSLSAAPEAEQATPAQQAQHQASDLASVGRLMSLLMELRARWRQRRSGHAEPAAAAPSSELAFLVGRLCECGGASAGLAAPRQSPTALQLLQLQALRLRTESWYYRRLAEEACDRLLLARRRLDSTDATLPQPSWDTDTKEQSREAQLAARESKLNLLLGLYELTHEHLDALKLPQLPPAQGGTKLATLSSALPSAAAAAAAVHASATSTAHNGGTRGADGVEAEQRMASQVSQEDSLDRLLIQTLLQQQHQLAGSAGALLAGAPAASGATPAGVRDGSHLSPQATTTATSVAAADDELLGLSPLACCTTADDGLLSTSAATPSVVAETLPALTTHRHVDVESVPGGGVATLTAAASTGHHPNNESRVAVVEVDLDAAENDGYGISMASQGSASPTAIHATPAGGFETRAVCGWTPTTTSPSASLSTSAAATLRQGAHGSPPPTSQQQRQQRQLFSPPLHASPCQDMQTPMRTPALPNMGYVGGAAGGAVASPGAGFNGGGGRSHSKYSALSLLRTPPSARRVGTGPGAAADAAVATAVMRAAPSFFRSPSLHSPDSYRSSTRPHNAATVDVSATAAAASFPHDTAERFLPQPRQQRRRSGSRGNTSNNSGGAYTATLGGRSPRTEDHHQHKDGVAASWAHQQLTTLEEMQTALRAQQSSTPRSRALAAAAIRSRSADMAAPPRMRSPATPPLAPRGAPRLHSASTLASSDVTPVRGTTPSYYGDDSAEMFRVESAHMRSSDSRSGVRRGDDWGGSAGAARDFGGVVTAAPPRVLLSFTPPYNTPPTSSPYIYEAPTATTTAAESGASLAYAATGPSAARDGAAGQHAPPQTQKPTATALYRSAPQEPDSSLSPQILAKLVGSETVAATRRGNSSRSGVPNAFHASAPSARGASARGNGAADLHQRTPPHHATSSSAIVSTVRAAASAFGVSAGISAQGTGGKGSHRSLSSRTASANATGHSAGGTSARGTTVSTSSGRASGGHGGGGGLLQRFGAAYSPSSSSASFAHAGASRTSSTTAVELLRRLRANTGA
ncbi:conserved hypothetical protein [Leishmania major strain Friedlin]|uniref:Uncharacterized protein n=1 Tax=Leishmania major TaxID=5664 RepID=Q4QJ19_LEIMA|nr:conserved hypothetical protein [Leishmania major strain Friedlin]CAG9568854.1 hypothetical_protein_-_conserved [Leishmania major strain Friedlin]CAJ02104.1 conserved hypothetical protein [Leishmania major strain Friedlin]|eukprot:XP_001680829.1 conserved hypothetical protein [Leishmania major strain Friedlin]